MKKSSFVLRMHLNRLENRMEDNYEKVVCDHLFKEVSYPPKNIEKQRRR